MTRARVKYQAGPDGRDRPYLWLEVTGINGSHGPVFGLVDSGADTTSMPVGYSALMGYTPADLKPATITQVQGTAQAWHAKKPSTAAVIGLEQFEFELCPLFVDGSLSVLWGRADFMREFGVAFDEPASEFILSHR